MQNKKAAAVMLAVIISSSSVSAYAAPVTMSDGTVFDPTYYAQTYPDVVAVFGTSPNALYSHYVIYGKNEGRFAVDPAATALANQDAVVKAAIMSFKQTYYEGLPWTDANNRYYNPKWNLIGYGCVAFAMTISDNVYGSNANINVINNPSPSDIRVGDVVKYYLPNNRTHWVVVTDVSDTSITICEGNYNSKIHWGRVVTKKSLQGRIVKISRRG